MKQAPAYRFCGRGVAAGQFNEALRGIALGSDGHVYAVGDSEVKVFTAAGAFARRWPTGRPGHAVAISDDGRVGIGQEQQVEI